MGAEALGEFHPVWAMAVQIAKLFGANNVIAPDRHAGRLAELPALGATATVLLDGDADDIADRLGQAAADVDVVVDYLWGEPAAAWAAAASARQRIVLTPQR